MEHPSRFFGFGGDGIGGTTRIEFDRLGGNSWFFGVVGICGLSLKQSDQMEQT
jgi:hypothetical protein